MSDDLLVKYILGETSAAESGQVKQWLEASPENLAYLQGLQKIWLKSRELAVTSDVNVDAAWQRFKSRVAVNDNKHQAPAKLVRFNFLRVAVVVMLLLGLGWMGWWWLQAPIKVQELALVSTVEVRNDTLPDGTAVTLNKNSELHFVDAPESGKRSVKLNGEAFFAVKRDSLKPFEVEAGPVLVTVLGTSFNVKNKADSVEVWVESGRVQVKYNDDVLILTAGEKTTIHPGQELKKVEQTDKLTNYYHSRVFVCDNTPLWRLVDVLNEAYGVQIIFGRKELRNLRWDITLKDESLDAILQLMNETFDIKVRKEEGKIILL